MAFGAETKEYIERKVAGLHSLAQKIGDGLESQAQSNADWTDRTGNTRRSIHGGADKTPKGTTLYLAHGSMVGLYFEKGTKPHVIRAKNKKALRFTSGGSTVFAKSVNHPGTKARPVVGPTVDSNIPSIQQAVKRYWEST